MAAAVGIAEVVLMDSFIMVPQPWTLASIVAAQILVCAAMLVPTWPSVSWKLICGCTAPGLFLAGLTTISGGYWAAFWLVGLPAWVLLCQRWSKYRLRRKFLEVLGFAALYAGASLLFALSVYLPNPAALLLPLVPAAQLYLGALPTKRNFPALIGLALSVGLVVLAALQPEANWGAPWSHAGAAVTGVLILASYTGRRPR